MSDKYKEIYLVTIVIKYNSVNMISNLPIRTQKITIHSELQKGCAEIIAYRNTLDIVEKKHRDGVQVIAYTVTKITIDIFDIVKSNDNLRIDNKNESEAKDGK